MKNLYLMLFVFLSSTALFSMKEQEKKRVAELPEEKLGNYDDILSLVDSGYRNYEGKKYNAASNDFYAALDIPKANYGLRIEAQFMLYRLTFEGHLEKEQDDPKTPQEWVDFLIDLKEQKFRFKRVGIRRHRLRQMEDFIVSIKVEPKTKPTTQINKGASVVEERKHEAKPMHSALMDREWPALQEKKIEPKPPALINKVEETKNKPAIERPTLNKEGYLLIEEKKLHEMMQFIESMRDQINAKNSSEATHSVVRCFDEIIGKEIKNNAHEYLGRIKEIMLDQVGGQIAYAVLDSGSFLGMNGKLFALPWKALKHDESEGCFRLDIAKDRLKNAPSFNRDNWPNMSDKSWGKNIHSYYATKAYWE